MRFSVANLLLLGTAIAAPVQEIERTGKASRGLAAVLPRVVIAPHPEPVIAPAHPEPVPRPIEPVAPGTEPVPGSPGDDTPGLRPNEPDAPAKPNEPGAPLRPEEPAPARPINGCLKKRCAPSLPGAKTSLKLDQKYTRKQNPLPANDGEIPSGKWIDEAGLGPDKLGPDDKWFASEIANSEDAFAAFEKDIIPKQRETMEGKPGWTKEDVDALIENEQGLLDPKNEAYFLVTKEMPKKGAIIVETSYNAERDLYRPFSGTGQGLISSSGKSYERPALNENKEQIWWSDMVMDNWRAATSAGQGDIKGLTRVGRDGIQTGETRDVLQKFMTSAEPKKTFNEGDAGFKEISDTIHGKGVQRMLDQNVDELGSKKITSYEVYQASGPSYQIMINIGPK